MNKFIKYFYSRKLAIALLIIIALLAFLETVFLRHIVIKSIYTRWWFILIWLALFLNLSCCNYLRIRNLCKKYEKKPKIILSYKEPQYVIEVNDSSRNYLKKVKSFLENKRYKIQENDNEIIGYKGRWAELWSIIFHLSFVIVMLGVIYHQVTFLGQG